MRIGPSQFLMIVVAALCLVSPSQAQNTRTPSVETVSAICNRDNATGIIAEQIHLSKTMDELRKCISILVRAADVLWPYEEQKARAAFSEALGLAVRNFRETGDVVKREGRLSVPEPDQRFVVIAAIAKRDREWARKVSDQLLQEEKRDAENKPVTDSAADWHLAQKLLNVAYDLLPSQPESALVFARNSLRYPATIHAPGFLYQLSEVNKSLADQFYLEALQAYAESPMEQFLYLSSYPFRNDREAGEMPIYTIYKVPGGLVPDPGLARSFLKILLRRTQQLPVATVGTTPNPRFSEVAQMWMALSRLEPQVETLLPDLLPTLLQAKGTLQALLNDTDAKRATQSLVPTPKLTFDERIQDALKQADPDSREGGIALAIISGADGEPLEEVVATTDKIDDSTLRAQVLSRLYFNRSQAALKDNDLDQARKLASKVDELDQRTYLYSQIAIESIKQLKSDVEIREMLEDVVSSATKAPDTQIKARALLGIAYLYSQVDANRGVIVLGDAVRSINKIEAPDFSRDYVFTRTEGKSFGAFKTLHTPGFNPENAFREMSKLDFDGTLYQAANFTNKSLRSMTTLAVVEPCLQASRKTK